MPVRVTEHTNAWVDESLWLQAHPEQWLLLPERPTRAGARGLARQIRIGALYAFRPAGHYAARVHGTQVEACYLGEDDLTP